MSFLDNKTPLGDEFITLEDSSQSLTIPAKAGAALIQCTIDGGLTDSQKLCAYTLNTDEPRTTGDSFILGLYDYLELTNLAQMQKFRAIVAEVGVTGCSLYVQYFETN